MKASLESMKIIFIGTSSLFFSLENKNTFTTKKTNHSSKNWC